jgi:hypothetical protein
MSKCSTMMNSRDFSRLAMVLIEKEEKLREIELKTAASVVIQATWRSVLARRKWLKMQSGFTKLQRIFRQRLQGREGDLWRQLRQSEKLFEADLEILKEKRRCQEKIFESIRQTPSSQLNAFFSREKESAALKIQVLH